MTMDGSGWNGYGVGMVTMIVPCWAPSHVVRVCRRVMACTVTRLHFHCKFFLVGLPRILLWVGRL